MRKQITAIIVGAGHRAILYSLYALEHPDELKIVGVADPDPIRRKKVAEMHGFGEEMCFRSAEELAERPKLADAVINGTMDRQHVPTAVPLLRAGYDMLLEKPFAISEEEVNYLYKVVKETGRKVMICHVLRYAPFYVAIKQRLLSGEIGDIINIQATEHVSYHHLAVSFVRGKWGNEEKCGAPMLLAKCCHDMDLIMWLKSPNRSQALEVTSSLILPKSPQGQASAAWWIVSARRLVCTPPKSIIWITRIGGRSMYGTAWRILRIRRWRTRGSR